jgi:hypothetical protein
MLNKIAEAGLISFVYIVIELYNLLRRVIIIFFGLFIRQVALPFCPLKMEVISSNKGCQIKWLLLLEKTCASLRGGGCFCLEFYEKRVFFFLFIFLFLK